MVRPPLESESAIRSLLQRLAAKDERAMRELHAMLGRRIVAFVMQRSSDQDLAESVMVDTLMEVWNHPDRFRFEAKFSTWVLGIARYKLLTGLRKSPAEHEDIADYEDTIQDPAPEASVQLEMREQAEVLRKCVEKLPEQQRECLHLLFFEGLPLLEIAELQKVPEGTVKTRLFHGRKNLKICVDRAMRVSS